MVPYICLVFIPILFGFFTIRPAENSIHHHAEYRKRTSIALFFILYFILLACRGEKIGADLPVYINAFERLQYTAWNRVFRAGDEEIGYRVLTKVISTISTNPRFFIAVVSALCVFPIYKLYKNESENDLIAISIFLILPVSKMLFSGLRQSLAVAMAVPAFYCVLKKRKLGFFLCVFIAWSFHQSALVLALLYPLYHVRITKKWLWFVMPILALMLKYNQRIFNTIMPYIGGKYAEQSMELTNTGAYTMIILFVIFSIYAYFMIDDRTIDKETIGLRNIILLATILQLFAPIHTLAMRMNYYFILFIPILISRVTNRAKKEYYQVAVVAQVLMVVFFISYFFVSLRSGESILKIYPYQFFWE